MAVIETWLHQDLQEPVKVNYLDGNLFSNNGNGNRIGVVLTNNGEALASISGTVSGYAVTADGSTVPCTGSKSGNRASILIPAAAYQPGTIFITVFVTDGTTVTTIGAVSTVVMRSRTNAQVDPGSVVTDWTQTINGAMQDVETAAENLGHIVATPYPSLTFPVPLGKYTYYNNNLYRCISPIASNESFTPAHWSSSLNLGDDVSDLKSALSSNINDIEGGLISENRIDLPLSWEYGIIQSDGTEGNYRTDYARTKGYYIPPKNITLHITRKPSANATVVCVYNSSYQMTSRTVYDTTVITLTAGTPYRFCVTSPSGTVLPLNDMSPYATFEMEILTGQIGKKQLNNDIGQYFISIVDLFGSASLRKQNGGTFTKTGNEIEWDSSDDFSYISYDVSCEAGKKYALYYDVTGTAGTGLDNYQFGIRLMLDAWVGGTIFTVSQTSEADASGTVVFIVPEDRTGYLSFDLQHLTGQEISGNIYLYDVTGISATDIDGIDFSKIGSSKMVIIGISGGSSINNWAGKKVVFYGDSITQGQYPELVQQKLQFNLVKNAIGGSRYGYISSDPSINANALSSDTRIAGLPSDADVVCIMGGTNDFRYTEIEETLVYSNGFDRTKFKGAIAYTIQKIQVQCPNAIIYLLTLVGGRGNADPTVIQPLPEIADSGAGLGKSSLDLRNATIEVAEYLNTQVIDTWSCGINGLNRATYMRDSVHPNSAGHRLIAEYIVSALLNNAPW